MIRHSGRAIGGADGEAVVHAAVFDPATSFDELLCEAAPLVAENPPLQRETRPVGHN